MLNTHKGFFSAVPKTKGKIYWNNLNPVINKGYKHKNNFKIAGKMNF